MKFDDLEEKLRWRGPRGRTQRYDPASVPILCSPQKVPTEASQQKAGVAL